MAQASTLKDFSRYIFLYFLFAVVSLHSNAQQGVLDVTFGNNGKVITKLPNTSSSLNTVALQSNGKIVAAGSSRIAGIPVATLVRYHSNGTVDSSFGINGIVQTQVGIECRIYSIAIQPDDKIVSGGSSKDSNQRENFTVLRYHANGTLDSTFGSNGRAITRFTNGITRINKVLLRADGRIVAGGLMSAFTFEEYSAYAQYNNDGSLDTTFGQKGINTTNIIVNPGGKSKAVDDMALTPDGKIVAAIQTYSATTPNKYSDFLLIRLTQQGLLDSTFGTNGRVLSDLNNFSEDAAMAVEVMQDGSIIATGQYNKLGYNQFVLVKYTSSGKMDSTFATNGKAVTTIDNANAMSQRLAIDSGGNMIVAGSNGGFVLALYDSNGIIDSSFGKRGYITSSSPFGIEVLRDCIVQKDGKIILAGVIQDSASSFITLARYERNRLVNYNTVTGSVFADQNSNGIQDVNEPLISNAKIKTTSTRDTVTTITSSGLFSIDIDTGLHRIAVIPASPYYTVVPATHTTNFSTYLNIDTVSFAVQPIPGKKDIAVNIIPLNVARPGFPAMYNLRYFNKGTQSITNGTIWFIKDSRLTFVSATTAPAAVSGDTLSWSYIDLDPNEVSSIGVNFTLNAPPATNIGDTLTLLATIFPVAGDLDSTDNSKAIHQIVLGSFDPNDKSEVHSGHIKTTAVAAGDYLQYTIRFQNTGTDTAFNVHIRDTLSNLLDWSTLQMISTSHDFELNITEGSNCNWAFKNINLVDSSTNPALSHGYITYIIKPKSTIAVGTIIKNTAAIYFDYNLPVFTNTEKTEVVAEVLPIKLLTFYARHEGQINRLDWKTSEESNLRHFQVERSTDNTEYETVGTVKSGAANYTFTDLAPKKGINYYRLKIVDRDGKYSYSPVRAVDNGSSLFVNIYPNPAKNHLQVQLGSDKRTNVILAIVTQDGKVVQTSLADIKIGTVLKVLNVSKLAPGIYFLRVGDSSWQVVCKFEKL